MPGKAYILTAKAAKDLEEAQAWSRSRWDKNLTDQYFDDLHEGAQYIAENHGSLRKRHELTGGTSLCLYSVREHYLVYEPLDDDTVAIVSIVRKSRDIPTILKKWSVPIGRELKEVRNRIKQHEIVVPVLHKPKQRKNLRTRIGPKSKPAHK